MYTHVKHDNKVIIPLAAPTDFILSKVIGLSILTTVSCFIILFTKTLVVPNKKMKKTDLVERFPCFALSNTFGDFYFNLNIEELKISSKISVICHI